MADMMRKCTAGPNLGRASTSASQTIYQSRIACSAVLAVWLNVLALMPAQAEWPSSPPPPTPISPAEDAARLAATISQERAILAPLGSGVSSASCEQATTDARAAGRLDLVKLIADICSKPKTGG